MIRIGFAGWVWAVVMTALFVRMKRDRDEWRTVGMGEGPAMRALREWQRKNLPPEETREEVIARLTEMGRQALDACESEGAAADEASTKR